MDSCTKDLFSSDLHASYTYKIEDFMTRGRLGPKGKKTDPPRGPVSILFPKSFNKLLKSKTEPQKGPRKN
jgi:hypothetical protein